MRSLAILLSLIIVSSLGYSQKSSHYSSQSKISIPPGHINDILSFSDFKTSIPVLDIEPAAYSQLMYRDLVSNKANNSSSTSLDLVLFQSLDLKFKAFPKYTFQINPLLNEGEYSSHLMSIENSSSGMLATIQTDLLEIKIPKTTFKSIENNSDMSLIFDIDGGIDYDSTQDLDINKIDKLYSMPFSITYSPIKVLKTGKAICSFKTKTKSDVLIDDEELSLLLSSYKTKDGKKLAKIDQVFELKGLSAEIKLYKHTYDGALDLYLIGDYACGVLEISKSSKLHEDLEYFINGNKKSSNKLKDDFKKLTGKHLSKMHYSITQNKKSVLIHFLMK